MHTNKRELKKQQQEKQTTECTKERSVTEPQPKTKTHHGGTETRRRSKPIFTTEDTKEHEGELKPKAHRRGRKGTQSSQRICLSKNPRRTGRIWSIVVQRSGHAPGSRFAD